MNLIGAPYQIIIGRKSEGALLEFKETATPRLIPINEKIDITFKKPSFFLAFKNLKVISFSNVEINLELFVLL